MALTKNEVVYIKALGNTIADQKKTIWWLNVVAFTSLMLFLGITMVLVRQAGITGVCLG